ncbi:MAG: transketolase C-terminal domain-containing protein, partial [Pseudomonadales bacterium]
AVRYPRGTGPNAVVAREMTALPIGKGVVKREGQRVAILSFGALLQRALGAAETVNATVVDMRFVKPLDEALILQMATQHTLLVTLEENTVMGGAGAAVNEYLAAQGVVIPVLNLGLPDVFLHHGKHGDLLDDCGLSAENIAHTIQQRLQQLQQNNQLAG